MDCSCNCLGVATAARVPVKRYNLLVPDIYPVVEPPFDRPLGVPIERKFKKLGEYLERNEHRAPKVSRRLARRLYSDLHRRRYGYVKLTVEAYIYLLKAYRPEKSSLFANELVVRSVAKRRRDWLFGPKQEPAISSQLGSVVGRLLSHGRVEVRALGVDLLTAFLRLQSTSDYVSQLEGFVALLCRDANPRLPFSGDRAPTPEQLAALRTSCLRALLEHLRFCARASYVSHHLDSITYAVLDNIEHAQLEAGPGDLASARQAAVEGLDPLQAMSRLSVSMRVAASPPDIAALLVLEQLSHITRDAAEGKKVVEFVMRYLDQGGRWLGSPVLATSMLILRQAAQQEHQHYILFSGLMRHVAMAPALPPTERAAVLGLAVEEARQLDAGLASPALLLALKELPPLVAAAPAAVVAGVPAPAPARASGQELELAARTGGAAAAAAAGGTSRGGPARPAGPQELWEAVRAALVQLAERLGSGMQLLEVVAAAVGQLRAPAPVSTAVLRCCVAAASASSQLSAKAAAASIPPVSFPRLLLQQLASLMATWEPAQRLLAHRLFLQLLPLTARQLKEGQPRVVLSALWHAAASSATPPAVFVAVERTLGAVLGASTPTDELATAQLAAELQAEAAEAGPAARLGQLPAAQVVALLLACRSLLGHLAATVGQPELAGLAAPGCEAVLSCLQLGSQGLQLQDTGGSGGALGPTSDGGDPDGGFASSAALAQAFTREEEQRAAAFLASWRAGTSVELERSRFAAGLARVPAFADLSGGAAVAARFEALPATSLASRLKAAGVYSGGSADSAAAEESLWARRVRELYHTVGSTRETEAGPGLAALAPVPEADHAASLSTAWSVIKANGVTVEDGDAKTADDVMAEVDAALEAAERQLAARRPVRKGGGAVSGSATFQSKIHAEAVGVRA